MRVIIPAAGKGTRLCKHSDMPKAMHTLCGTPIIDIVLKNTSFISPKDTFIVVGYMKEMITEHLGNGYNFIEQNEQRGTGHAVMMCEQAFKDYEGTVLIAFGDMPMFRYESMKAMCDYHESCGAECTLMTAENPSLTNWAKIIRDENGRFVSIKEGSDCVGKDKSIKELFAGVLVFDSKALFEILPELKTDNAQEEYYLTEVPEIMVRKGKKVETYMTDNSEDLFGVNTAEDIIKCEEIFRKRQSTR